MTEAVQTTRVTYGSLEAAANALRVLASIPHWRLETEQKLARLTRVQSEHMEDLNGLMTKLRGVHAKRDEKGRQIPAVERWRDRNGELQEIVHRDQIVPLDGEAWLAVTERVRALEVEVPTTLLLTEEDWGSFDPPENYDGPVPSPLQRAQMAPLTVTDPATSQASGYRKSPEQLMEELAAATGARVA